MAREHPEVLFFCDICKNDEVISCTFDGDGNVELGEFEDALRSYDWLIGDESHYCPNCAVKLETKRRVNDV